MQRNSSLNHGGRVQYEGREQEEIINPIITAEALPPEKNRVNRAEAVGDYGQQK